nr:class I SAM-dependent methyltransferase [uncultured Prevotella sp.]
MNQATIDFIRQHQDEDVRQLAFLGSKYPDVDMPFALDQIRGRQMARTKLPRWANIDGIIYPPHISMEQCSSEVTAMYKAELAARLVKNNQQNARIGHSLGKINFLDMTGGFGVDFSYIAAQLGVNSMYVERQAHLCEAAKENFERLGLKNAIVKNGDGVEVLHSFGLQEDESPQNAPNAESCQGRSAKPLQLIFIDPARRDDAGNKVVSLQDCTPDVTLLQDEMLEKSDFVIIKLSPMLDWHRAVNELKQVREVHIVSTGNECKELLLVLSSTLGDKAKSSTEVDEAHASETDDETSHLKVYCINDNQVMSYDESDKSVVSIASEIECGIVELEKCSNEENDLPQDGSKSLYLYEPNASLMKAGCFGVISSRYGVKMLAKNSHLFVSEDPVADFPGRSFRIKAVSSFNKKDLKRQLSGITKANIATRNFPLSVTELRKRLKLKDGGDTYIFATTLSDESHVLFICEKV